MVDDGTASQWQIPGYTIAAKTGTARKPNPLNGSYNWGGNGSAGYRYTTVFSGFLPASDPQLSITVLLDEPVNGGECAGGSGPTWPRR